MITRSYSDRIEQAISRAQELADESGETFAVVEIDNDPEDRAIRVVPEWYCDLDEFYAFDGEVLEVLDPTREHHASSCRCDRCIELHA